MRLAFVLAFVLIACVPPDDDAPEDVLPDPVDTPAPSDFDAPRWIEDVAALDTLDDLDERDARSRDLAAQLDAVTAWTQECDMDDPSGQLYLHDLGNGTYLAEAVCFMAAYQPNIVLIGIESDNARVLTFALYDETGTVTEPEARNLGGYVAHDTLATIPEAGTFDVVSLARGAGGCGVMTRYRLAGDRAEPVRVRAQSCDTECADTDCVDPARWPLVLPAESDSTS